MFDGFRSWTRRGVALALPSALVLRPTLVAADDKAKEDDSQFGGDKPFSEHKLVLQLSDQDSVKHKLVLSVAYNLLSIYTPDGITMEVVVFADGMSLLDVNSEDRQRVDSLIAQGVRFSACGNTLDKIKRNTGHEFPLNPKAVRVNAGAARILALSEHGFTIIKP